MSHPITQLNRRNHPKENDNYWHASFMTLFLGGQFQNRCGSNNSLVISIADNQALLRLIGR